MKMETVTNTMQTNVKVKSKEFGIGDVSAVIEILRSKLYSNPIQTLAQEYLCNGRDAMREINSKKAIQVTVPAPLNPVFKVRDFGPGVSPDRMNNVFIMYGASTKRKSNKQTGGFGIGSKIAWAYTDSFTITTFINGTKRVYCAHIGVNKNGMLDLLSTEKTSEPNGTEIQLAVSSDDLHAFKNAIFRATYFWTEKVEYLGINKNEVPERVEGFRLNELEVIERQSYDYQGARWPNFIQGGDFAIIDGIPYPLADSLYEHDNGLSNLKVKLEGKMLLHVPNGTVKVAASREAISDEKSTNEYLEVLSNKLNTAVDNYVKGEFKVCKTPYDYLNKYMDLCNTFDVSDYREYKSYTMSDHEIDSELFKTVRMVYVNFGDGDSLKKYDMNAARKSYRSRRKSALKTDMFNHLFFNDGSESIVKFNRRIRKYLNEVNGQLIYFEVCSNIENSNKNLKTLRKDLGLKNLLSLPVPEVIKKERVKRHIDKTKFCLHIFKYYGRGTEYTTSAENETKWLYVPMSKGCFNGGYTNENLRSLDSYLNGSYRVCGISEKSLKLIKGNSNFIPLDGYLKALKPTKKITGWLKKEHSCNGDLINDLNDLKDIKDKKLDTVIKEYKAFCDTPPVPNLISNKFADNVDVISFLALDKEVKKLITKKYPLVEEIGHTYHKSDLALYINAKYNKRG